MSKTNLSFGNKTPSNTFKKEHQRTEDKFWKYLYEVLFDETRKKIGCAHIYLKRRKNDENI